MHKLYFSKFEATDFNLYFQLVSNEKVMAQITERTIPLGEAQNDYKKLLKRNKNIDYSAPTKCMTLLQMNLSDLDI